MVLGTASAMCGVYCDLWRMMLAFTGRRYEEQARLTSKMQESFRPVDVAVNMVLNILALNATHLALAYAAGFSQSFLRFSLLFIVLPSLLGSVAYIYFKYGPRMWKFSSGAVLGWLHNWMLVHAIAMVCWTQHAVLHAVPLALEPLLPEQLQGPLVFPVHVMERYFIDATIGFHVMGVALILALPLWKYAYRLNMELVDRKSEISTFECFMELVYTGSTSMAVYMIVIPIAVLHGNLGFPFHIVHVLLGVVEIVFINYVVKYKFFLMHQLSHSIKPLYQMVHLEHHVCKGIYPNTAAGGLWEFWMLAGSFGFYQLPVMSLPYVHFNLIYCGANILVHTMWPAKSCTQWHTLHHVVLADVYSVNIPSDHDRAFSKDFAKYDEKLRAASLFVRHEWLSDAVAGVFALVATTVLHYALGWSLFAVWHERH